MTTYNTKNPLGSAAVKDLYDNAENLDWAVNDLSNAQWTDRLGIRRKTLSGQERDFEAFMLRSNEEFQEFLLASGYVDLGDYEQGLTISSRNQVFRKDGELYRAGAGLDLPYTTTGVWTGEGSNFVSVGDAALRQEIENRTDASLGVSVIGYSPSLKYPAGSLGYRAEAIPHLFDKPAVQATQISPAISYSDNDWSAYVDSMGDSLYRHSPRIVRDAAGMYHMVYSLANTHGFGGFNEANAVDPQGKIIYVNSWDLFTWSNELAICFPDPPDVGLNPFRTVFDCQIGITPSGRIAVVVSDIPPPSATPPGGWGRYTGNTRYKLITNDHRGAAFAPDGSDAWVQRGVFFEHDQDYARIYSNGIKQMQQEDGSIAMVFLDYRRISSTQVAIGQFASYDEFDTLPVRESDILVSAGSNETDITQVSPRLHFAVSRADFTTSMSTDGRKTWTVIGSSANFDRVITGANGLIAPVIGTVWRRGNPFLLVGWAERGVTPRSIRWVTASVKELFAFKNAVAASQLYTPWTIVSQSGPAFTGSGGYHSPIIFEDGTCAYVDVTETTNDPVTGLMRAQLRVVRFGIEDLFPHQYGLMLSKRSRLGQHNEDENAYNPALVGSTTTGTGTVTMVGTNTRTGNRCVFNGTLTVNGQSGYAGSMRVAGLPYRSMDGLSQLINVEVTSTLAVGWNAADRVVGLIISDTNYIALYKKVAATQALQGLAATDLGTNFSCHVSGNYKCRFPGNQ